MIPVRLQLRNFMSYGEGVPPLELSGVRLACLSGDNGNGKTALLDAMTWALFDQCRAKIKDDVIRLGAPGCAVILEFLVDGVRYRVDRRISRKAAGATGGGSQWELQVRREDNSWHPLSGTTQRDTQEKIVALLRMDYDTFLSTAYLAQGRADEFARATPNKRKEVLADILNLSRYDRLEEMAKEQEKEAKEKETDLSRTLSAIDTTLASRDRYEMALEDATRRLLSANTERDALHEARQEVLAAVERLHVFEERARTLSEKIADAEEKNAEETASVHALLPRIASAQTLVDRAGEIEAAVARKTELEAEVSRLETVYNRALELGRECGNLERLIRAEEGRLSNERYAKQCYVDELERDLPQLADYERKIAELERGLSAYEGIESATERAEAQRQTIDDQMATLKDRHAASQYTDTALAKRIEALQSSDAPMCDYCGQPVPPGKRKAAVAEAEAERRANKTVWDAVKAEARAVRQQSDALKAETDTLTRSRQAQLQSETQIRLFAQEVTRFRERVKLLPKARAERDALDETLRTRDFLHAEQEKLSTLSAERERAEAAHVPLETARAGVAALRNAPRDLDALYAARELLQIEPAQVADLQARIAKRTAQIASARVSVAKAQADAADLPVLRQNVSEFDAQITTATETVERANRDIGQWTSQLAYCREQEAARIVHQAELSEAVKQRDLYKELAAAFGKKGVQALIIENALPEIVTQANELLAKLSQDAMQVELRTTRDAKTKGASAIETLDIIISDEMGTRPYEMFSGGEAFRVNFALRVALSRVLASRAGAPLQTLIVDEGFGTQDPRGREAITEALTNIQEYFQLILCITHIEEIKETFPTRIEVTKGANGSTFTMN